MSGREFVPLPQAASPVDPAARHQPLSGAETSGQTSPMTTKEERLKRVYITSAIYLAVALLQLSLVKVLDFDFAKAVPVPGFVWIFVSLICFCILWCSSAVHLFPVNWTLSVLVVEAITLSVISRNWYEVSLIWVPGIYLIVLLIHVILFLLAIFLPLKMLPGTSFILVATIIFIIVFSLLMVIIYATEEDKLWIYLCLIFVTFLTLLVFYLLTIIHERRLDTLIAENSIIRSTIGAALFLYMIHYVAELICAAEKH